MLRLIGDFFFSWTSWRTMCLILGPYQGEGAWWARQCGGHPGTAQTTSIGP